jgi:regulatory protein
MNLLARREHSRNELRQKLCKRFSDTRVIDQQIDRLAEENLQSDARFAESFVRQRFGRGQGPLRIRQDMRQRGIADDDIQSAMTAEDYDWFASAASVMERKFGSGPAADIHEKARRSRFMQYRGFELEHYQHLF